MAAPDLSGIPAVLIALATLITAVTTLVRGWKSPAQVETIAAKQDDHKATLDVIQGDVNSTATKQTEQIATLTQAATDAMQQRIDQLEATLAQRDAANGKTVALPAPPAPTPH